MLSAFSNLGPEIDLFFSQKYVFSLSTSFVRFSVKKAAKYFPDTRVRRTEDKQHYNLMTYRIKQTLTIDNP